MYLVNLNLDKSNSLLTRTKFVFSLDRNWPQGGKSGGCGYTEDVHRGYGIRRFYWTQGFGWGVQSRGLKTTPLVARDVVLSKSGAWFSIITACDAWFSLQISVIGEYHLKLEAQTLIKNRNSWHHFPVLFLVLGGKDGAAVRAVASQQCGPGSNPGVNAICGFWVCCCFSPLFREVFLWVVPPFPVLKNQHWTLGIG